MPGHTNLAFEKKLKPQERQGHAWEAAAERLDRMGDGDSDPAHEGKVYDNIANAFGLKRFIKKKVYKQESH